MLPSALWELSMPTRHVNLRDVISLAQRSSGVRIALIMLPLFWLIYFAWTSLEQRRAVQQGELHATNVAQIFQENTERIFLGVDATLLLLRRFYESNPKEFDLKYWVERTSLTSASVVQISLIGADGYLTDTTTDYQGPRLYLGDREHFVKVANLKNDMLYVGKPVLGRVSGKWTIQIARRLRDADGNFAGVIVSSVDPEQVGTFIETAQLGEHGSLVLRNADNIVLASRGISSPAIGKKIDSPALDAGLRRSPAGTYWGGGIVDGINRLVAYRKSDVFPLVFTAGLAEDQVFFEYRRHQLVYLSVATVLSLILTIAGFLDCQRLLSLAQKQQELESMAIRFRSATENMSQGLSMFDADGRLVAYNTKYLQMYRLPPERIGLGSSIKEILDLRAREGTFSGDSEQYVNNLITSLTRKERVERTIHLSDEQIVRAIYCPKDDGGWVSTHEDVTERKRAETELSNVKAFLDTIIQSIPMPIVIKEPHSRRVIFVNRAYEAFLGLSSDKIVGKTADEFLPKDVAALIENHDTRALNWFDKDLGGEFSLTAGTGERRIVTMSRAVVRDSDQKAQYLIALIDDITERKNSQEKIERLALYDALTDLANRNLFREKVEESLARLRRLGTEFAIFQLDLDSFKDVNDTYGHQAGDTLLKEVATRIKATIREVDVAARLGGDEFALLILMGQKAIKGGVESLAARLVQAISAPYNIEGQTIVIGCSIGIAFAPKHGDRADEILKNADLALYKAKNEGRNCFRVYDETLKLEADSRNALENDLRQAVWHDEFELNYQPIIENKTGRIRAVETLVRWHHPIKGIIAPAEFIPLAEETGLIVQLGEWIIANACHDAMRMPDGIRVAVNLSPVQFAKSNVVDAVICALVDSQLPPERLEIEITENVLLSATDQNLAALHQLKNLGISISLDDFGVGYSSLSYLTSFPFDKVKVDRSFVEKLDRTETKAVVSSIVQLSRTLKLVSCAEGIESEKQLRDVTSLGIELGQGYFFGLPVPLLELDFSVVHPIADATRAA
jgi:diguanylate cyclase (GGDEF)-like protein/PAS domain S-box-containing protein